MSNVQLLKFSTREELFNQLANDCEASLKKSIDSSQEASFIIPGGTTPGPAFELLSKKELDWSKVSIAQSDERWLDAEHDQSNEKLTKRTLLINHASQANYIAMKNSSATALDGKMLCNQDYRSLLAPFSITMLGMGLDGHFASLFPSSKTIEEALDLSNKDLCIEIDATGCSVAGEYTERMSLTLSAILNSEQIILLITGKAKLQLIEDVLVNINLNTDINTAINTVINTVINDETGPALPIRYLLEQKETDVNIYWAE